MGGFKRQLAHAYLDARQGNYIDSSCALHEAGQTLLDNDTDQIRQLLSRELIGTLDRMDRLYKRVRNRIREIQEKEENGVVLEAVA